MYTCTQTVSAVLYLKEYISIVYNTIFSGATIIMAHRQDAFWYGVKIAKILQQLHIQTELNSGWTETQNELLIKQRKYNEQTLL